MERRACSSEDSPGRGSVESPVYKKKVKPSGQKSWPRKEGCMGREKAGDRAWPRKQGHDKEAIKPQKNRSGVTSQKVRRKSRVRMEGVTERGSGIKHGKCHSVWRPGVRWCLLSEELPAEPRRQDPDIGGLRANRRRGRRHKQR